MKFYSYPKLQLGNRNNSLNFVLFRGSNSVAENCITSKETDVSNVNKVIWGNKRGINTVGTEDAAK